MTQMNATPQMIEASRKLELCAQFSIDNPTIPLKDNPHFRESERLQKLATGSMRKFWVCVDCTRVLARLDDEGLTQCCGAQIRVQS